MAKKAPTDLSTGAPTDTALPAPALPALPDSYEAALAELEQLVARMEAEIGRAHV